jgi:hypothetical protein
MMLYRKETAACSDSHINYTNALRGHGVEFMNVKQVGRWNFSLLGYYEACSGNTLPTFRDNLLVSFLRVKKISVPIGCPETSVRNYHYRLRNSPEERRCQLLRGGRLKFRNNEQYCECRRRGHNRNVV